MAKVSCRKAFSNTLLEVAKEDKNIYTIATDSRGSVTTSQFFKELPEQERVRYLPGLLPGGKIL